MAPLPLCCFGLTPGFNVGPCNPCRGVLVVPCGGQAIPILEGLVRTAPSVADSYQTLGLIYEALGDGQRALKLFVIAAHLTPKDADLWKRVASLSRCTPGPLHLQPPGPQRAEPRPSFWSALCPICPLPVGGTERRLWRCWCEHGVGGRDAGCVSQALYCLAKVIRRNPQDLDARWDRAVLLAELGQCQAAVQALEPLSSTRAGDPAFCCMLARVRQRGTSGPPSHLAHAPRQEAPPHRLVLQIAVGPLPLCGACPGWWSNEGLALAGAGGVQMCAAVGQPLKAVAVLEALVQQHPADVTPTAVNILADIYLEQGRAADALALIDATGMAYPGAPLAAPSQAGPRAQLLGANQQQTWALGTSAGPDSEGRGGPAWAPGGGRAGCSGAPEQGGASGVEPLQLPLDLRVKAGICLLRLGNHQRAQVIHHEAVGL